MTAQSQSQDWNDFPLYSCAIIRPMSLSMVYLLVGGAVVVVSLVGLWFSDGQMKSFARGGSNAWIALAVAAGVGLGVGFLISGILELAN